MKTTPIKALLAATNNWPIKDEYELQTIQLYEKLTCNKQKNKWFHRDRVNDKLKTQKYFKTRAEELLPNYPQENNVLSKLPPINPTDYIEITTETSLDEEVCKTTDIPEKLLQITLRTINTKYPSNEWLRIYTDGSLTDPQGSAGAGIYCKYFSQYLTLNQGSTVFEAEIQAIATALTHILHNTMNENKIVLLIDSKSAIEAINNQQIRTAVIDEIRYIYKSLEAQGRKIVLQWVPSHVGLQGNEQADFLAKQGTSIIRKPKQHITINGRLKQLRKERNKKTYQETKENLSGKSYENIHQYVKSIKHLPRKTTTALLRLYTGHDCLNEHLNRFGLKTSKFCTICNSPAAMNKDHLLQCRNLDPNKQARRDLAGLYWEARGLMA